MSGWQDAYLPEGGDRDIREEQSERREMAIQDQIEYLWDSVADPLKAAELVVHGEVGAESLASILMIAGYARTKAGKTDQDYICQRLVELFEKDIRTIAEFNVDTKGY